MINHCTAKFSIAQTRDTATTDHLASAWASFAEPLNWPRWFPGLKQVTGQHLDQPGRGSNVRLEFGGHAEVWTIVRWVPGRCLAIRRCRVGRDMVRSITLQQTVNEEPYGLTASEFLLEGIGKLLTPWYLFSEKRTVSQISKSLAQLIAADQRE